MSAHPVHTFFLFSQIIYKKRSKVLSFYDHSFKNHHILLFRNTDVLIYLFIYFTLFRDRCLKFYFSLHEVIILWRPLVYVTHTGEKEQGVEMS